MPAPGVVPKVRRTAGRRNEGSRQHRSLQRSASRMFCPRHGSDGSTAMSATSLAEVLPKRGAQSSPANQVSPTSVSLTSERCTITLRRRTVGGAVQIRSWRVRPENNMRPGTSKGMFKHPMDPTTRAEGEERPAPGGGTHRSRNMGEPGVRSCHTPPRPKEASAPGERDGVRPGGTASQAVNHHGAALSKSSSWSARHFLGPTGSSRARPRRSLQFCGLWSVTATCPTARQGPETRGGQERGRWLGRSAPCAAASARRAFRTKWFQLGRGSKPAALGRPRGTRAGTLQWSPVLTAITSASFIASKGWATPPILMPALSSAETAAAAAVSLRSVRMTWRKEGRGFQAH